MPVTETFDVGPEVRERIRARALERGGQIRRRRSMVRRSLTLALIVTLPVAGILVARQAGRPTGKSNITTSSLPANLPASSWRIAGSFTAVPRQGAMTGIGGELSAPGVPGLWEIEWGPDGRPMLFGFNSLSGRVIADIPLPVPATQISSTGRAAAESPMIGDPVISGTTEWVGSADEIVGVDLLTHRVIAHVHNPAGTIGVLVSDGSLWVSTHSRLERLSETTGQMTAEINLPDAGSCGISPAADGSGEIVVVTYSYPCNAADVATGTETIYTVGSARAAVLHRFTLRVRSLQVAPGPFLPVAVTPGLVWGADADIAGREGPELVALDQATGRVRFALALHLSAEQEGPKLVASAATTASFAFGYLWVAAGEDIALVDPSTGALLREMAIVPARAYENSIINGVAQDEVSSVSFTPNDVVVHLSETGPSVEGDVVLQPARTAGAS